MAKVNAVVSFKVNEDGTIGFNVVGAGGTMTLYPDKVSTENTNVAKLQGFITRVTRAAALSRDTDTGASASPEAKRARVEAVINHLNSGSSEWNLKSSAERAGPDSGLIVTALCFALTNGDIDKANSLIDGLAKKRNIGRNEALKIWAATPQVLDAISKIKAKNAKAGADDLLAELGAD